MTKLIRDYKEEVLVDVAHGKRYLNKPDQVCSQVRQKKNTCFYYVFSPVRFHYGKGENFGKERAIEKLFSEFRKEMNRIEKSTEEFYICLHDIKKELNLGENTSLTKKIVASYYANLLTQAKIYNVRVDLEAEDVRLCTEFLKHDECTDLEEFIQVRENEEQIILCKKNLEKLESLVSLNFSTLLQVHIGNLKSSFKDTTGEYTQVIDEYLLSESEANSGLFLKIMTNIMAENYGLIKSSWCPRKPESLMESLRLYGPQVVSTVPVLGLDKSTCEKKEEIEGATIYEFSQINAEENDSHIGHCLLLVGLKKEGKNYSVYYMDPNDPNPSQGQQTIYKIPYELFCSRLTNIYGVNFQEETVDEVNGPFAHHLPLTQYDKIYRFVTSGIGVWNENGKSIRKRPHTLEVVNDELNCN